MRIDELFRQGAAPWQWEKDTISKASTSFVVNDTNYKFVAYEVEDALRKWNIQFFAVDGYYNVRVGITGTGSSATVMSTVVDIMRNFLSSRPEIESIEFSADEPSRRSLYAKMVRRLLPTWKMETINLGSEFTLTAPRVDASYRGYK
jgi:hypothetical protein